MKKGTFTTVWDDDVKITTHATVDEITGYIDGEQVDVDDMNLDILTSEYFTDDDGNVYDVCPECHTYILKQGSTCCMNPDCDNN